MIHNILEINDFHSLIYAMEQRVKQLLIDDSKKPEWKAEPYWSMEIIEDEILPALEKFLEVWDDDPTPQYLYDNTGGEPPVTAAEMHSAAWKQHQEMHSWAPSQHMGISTSLLVPFIFAPHHDQEEI